jgi:hypothetical protein
MDKCSKSRSISLYVVTSLSLRRLRYIQSYAIIICRVILLFSIRLVVIAFY